jgi:subtilisin family serine protease
VQRIATGLGVSVTSVKRIASTPHWVLTVTGSGTPASAEAVRSLLRKDTRFAFVAHAYKTTDWNNDVLPLSEVIVRAKPGVSRGQIEQKAAALGSRVIRAPDPANDLLNYLLAVPVDSAEAVLDIANELDRDPLIDWATPDMISDYDLASVPSDPLFSSQYYLHNTITVGGVPADINVEPAWDLTKGSSSIRITFVDAGLDISHPEFSGRAGSFISLDKMAALSTEPGEGAGHPYSHDSHGTAVAGIAAAAHDGVGIAGIAPNVSLGSVRIIRDGDNPNLSLRESASASDIADGLTWAANHSDIVSNSWGGGAPNTAIAQAIAGGMTTGRGGLGAIFVFSAGNDSATAPDWEAAIGDPNQYPELAVVAMTMAGQIASYSNRAHAYNQAIAAFGGTHVNLTCNGADVVTTDLSYSHPCNDGPGGDNRYTSTFSGTSAAAPQVSGAAALLLSREPTLTASQVRTRIFGSADPWQYDQYDFGNGKLNIMAALTGSLSVTIDGPTSGGPMASCYWVANVTGGTAPYTYLWVGDLWKGQTINGQSATLQAYVTYNLVVVVHDSNGATGQGYLQVAGWPDGNCS